MRIFGNQLLNMKRSIYLLLPVFLILSGCSSTKDTAQKEEAANQREETVDNAFENLENTQPRPEQNEQVTRPHYNPSRTRVNDVEHMKLEISFDWSKRRANGKATLDISPYFYPVSTVTLDAKGFFLHKVGMILDGQIVERPFQYDSAQVTIELDREYRRDEQYQIYIEYTARPDEQATGGSDAIASDKGLYFINPDSTQGSKPTQIWTQGETEANSRWFPTVDSPNEKITQELFITVDDKYKTLSNGTLIASELNGDNTRTDYWKQDDPHAPYLVMMAIGDFAVVEDSWTRSDGTKMDVHYYVEHEYEPYAKSIFGDTPDMLSFFSELLGVEYPWDKYHQVIVRDYVSGAMENTTAVIHGEFFNQTDRELLDENNFSTIAHELFHHWFGDLVTCESWANLPLNESFANYSQYLWDEYRYGRDEADYQAESEMMGYIYTAQQSGYVDMIRFGYEDKEDMFDGNSYNKGGRILHMLRKYLGDDAFFTSLKKYLNDNAYQAAEIHDLRLAFEEVSGEDLNWFFNQWFLDKGHAKLKYGQTYNPSSGILTISIDQLQDFDLVPLYKLPIDIDIYVNGNKERQRVWVEEIENSFEFEIGTEPDLVIFDAERCMLAEIDEEKPREQYLFQYYNAPLYADRAEAVEQASRYDEKEFVQLIIDAMDDDFHGIRSLAARKIRKGVRTDMAEDIRKKLMKLAQHDENPSVRIAAMGSLERFFDDHEEFMPMLEGAIMDPSFGVEAQALEFIYDRDKERGFDIAKGLMNEKSSTILTAVGEIFAEKAGPEMHDFYTKNMSIMGGFQKVGFVKTYSRYLKRQEIDEIEKGIDVFADIAMSGGSVWVKYFGGYQELQGFAKHFLGEEKRARRDAEALEENGGDTGEIAALQQKERRAKEMKEEIMALIEELKAKETDQQVLLFMGNEE